MDVVNVLIEHGASVLVKSKRSNPTPRDLLKAQRRHVQETRKRSRPSPTPQSSCPGAAARSRFAIFEWQTENSMHEPIIDKSQHSTVVENEDYWVCESVKDCAKRLRRSEREFAVDHANLHSEMPWCETLTTKDAATLVGVVVDDKAEDKHVACVEELASALKPSSFTLTAVSQTTNMDVYSKYEEQELTIGQVKVDRGHQGKGLGGLLLQG
ncbi:unnamed protein product [Symbiodinium sp. CCMP2456]|nr:unnamed protein product [Symbiodinium sp. CCMP2456]